MRFPVAVLFVYGLARLRFDWRILVHVHHARMYQLGVSERKFAVPGSLLELWSVCSFCCYPQFVDSPPELAAIPHCFKLTSEKKPIFLFSDTEELHMAWRRRIREAVRQLRVTNSTTTPESDELLAAKDAASGSGDASGAGPREDAMDEPSTYAFVGAVGA